jgi:hypothetical protein
MSVINDLLKDVPLPKMVKVRQLFPSKLLVNIESVLRREFEKQGVGDSIKPGMRIAIAVGSRGIDELVSITRVTVEEIRKRGGIPFIVPSMGSHGAATAEGQTNVLLNLGVTEESVGCPIHSCMDVVEIDRLDNGLFVLMDRLAFEADGVVVINRIKPHTQFRGPCESGLAKMITIGLGKQKGADSCHAYGFHCMAENILEMAKIKIQKTNILFGIATVESPYDKIVKVVAVPAERILREEQELLVEAKQNMPMILFDQMDVLIVDQIGKEISGGGMDPNITGRYAVSYMKGGPAVNKIVVLNVTQATHGNANGIGMADYTTRKLVDQIDYDAIYANALTIAISSTVKIPMILSNDKEAIQAAVKTCNIQDLSLVRLVRIKNTLHLGEIYISEAMLPEALSTKGIEVCGQPDELEFDQEGNLSTQSSF